jgi:hypothetical protein
MIALQSIVNKGSHISQAYRAAYVLSNCDEGEYSLGKSTKELYRKQRTDTTMTVSIAAR